MSIATWVESASACIDAIQEFLWETSDCPLLPPREDRPRLEAESHENRVARAMCRAHLDELREALNTATSHAACVSALQGGDMVEEGERLFRSYAEIVLRAAGECVSFVEAELAMPQVVNLPDSADDEPRFGGPFCDWIGDRVRRRWWGRVNWDRVLDGVAIEADRTRAVETESTETGNEIRFERGVWHFRLGQHSGVLHDAHYKGCYFIYLLVQRQGEVVPNDELIAAERLFRPTGRASVAVTAGEDLHEPRLPRSAWTTGMIKDARRVVEENKLRMKEAGLPLGQREDLERDTAKIERELNREVGLAGRAKQGTKEQKRAADRMRNLVNRALGALRQQDEALAKHFDGVFFFGGSGSVYRPQELIQWQVAMIAPTPDT